VLLECVFLSMQLPNPRGLTDVKLQLAGSNPAGAGGPGFSIARLYVGKTFRPKKPSAIAKIANSRDRLAGTME
jgi:hypothetical protein